MIDTNITWKDHIQTVEKNLQKNLGLLHCAKHVLDNDSLKNIYFSYIHLYLNYDNNSQLHTIDKNILHELHLIKIC